MANERAIKLLEEASGKLQEYISVYIGRNSESVLCKALKEVDGAITELRKYQAGKIGTTTNTDACQTCPYNPFRDTPDDGYVLENGTPIRKPKCETCGDAGIKKPEGGCGDCLSVDVNCRADCPCPDCSGPDCHQPSASESKLWQQHLMSEFNRERYEKLVKEFDQIKLSGKWGEIKLDSDEVLELVKGGYCTLIIIDQFEADLKAKDEEIDGLKKHLSHIGTSLLILKNTKSEEGIKDLPYLASRLHEYIEQALTKEPKAQRQGELK